MVEVFALRLPEENELSGKMEYFLSFLSEERRDYFSQFKKSKSAQRSVFGELISRKILSEKLGAPVEQFEFGKTKNGKPYLRKDKVHFNLSHSGEWVVFAISNRETGIDIEKIRPVNYRIAERFFSDHENEILSQLDGKKKLEYFFDLWTLKESYLKKIGTGLTKSLNSFTIWASGNEFRIEEHDKAELQPVRFRQYPIDDGYRLSVCSDSDIFSETLVNLTPDEVVNFIGSGR
ncbi:MAG: 4'-phosphopantetheinyl transferase superfamily protein [Bacteroidetes bacterium]|nr:4'-phosphopantetheinyl transferase superfamily protein [Bacteroidota bacterium]